MKQIGDSQEVCGTEKQIFNKEIDQSMIVFDSEMGIREKNSTLSWLLECG